MCALITAAVLGAHVEVQSPAATHGQAGAAADHAYHAALQCGRNALLVFLVLAGHTGVRTSQLTDIPITAQGASLLALRRAAGRFGVRAQVRRYPVTSIDTVALPAIIQTRNRGAGALTSDHFYVLYKVGKHHVYMVDATTAELKPMKKPFLPGIWTGYALVPARWYEPVVDVRWLPMLILSVSCFAALWLPSWALRPGAAAVRHRASPGLPAPRAVPSQEL